MVPLESHSDPHDSTRYLNRELSWLDFNERVLALAADDRTPLLERVKFLAIFSSNLDEFFQVRVAGLKDQIEAGVKIPSPDGLTPREALAAVHARTVALSAEADHLFLDVVAPALADAGVVLSSWEELDEDDREWLAEEFERRVFPVLTPLAVDPGHPFPYISNLSLNLGVLVRDPATGDQRFARVKVPPLLPRFVLLPDGERVVPLEEVIAARLDHLFPGMEIEQHFTFRVTRNADLTLEEEEADDLLAAIEIELRRRRFSRAVRVQVEAGLSEEILDLLLRELELSHEDVEPHHAPIDLSGLWTVYALDRPELKYPAYAPVTQRLLAPEDEEDAVDLFAVLRRGDVLVHHPYESFGTSVEEFIRQAAGDPAVLAIKLTLYRTSGDSSIVANLIRAAERGKQVVALVELKARFDEQNNIEWARRLERAGVHVVYGLVGLKTHTKTALVARNELDGVRRYCHIGTGNYNPKTARMYEDLGLLTADERIGSDLSHLFNYLTGYARNMAYQRLLVAPHDLRPRLLGRIRHEASLGDRGHVVMKMNSLVDPEFIDELYAASAAGTRVELIVRGICCLRPGVPGLSENITVRSIIGRYLEHSRVYRFANGAGEGRPIHYLGSADLMPRNLDRRVEALVPVEDPALQDRLDTMLSVNLADDSLAWVLEDDRWHAGGRQGAVDTHVELQERARKRAAVEIR